VADGSVAAPTLPPGTAGPLLDALTRPFREQRARALKGRARWLETRVEREPSPLATSPHRSAGAWHRARARALLAGPHARAATCGERTVERVCRHCGEAREVPVGCGTKLTCGDCYGRATRRLRARMLASIEAHDARERARGRRPSLLTLTMRASASMDADARLLARAWARLRAWFAKQGLRALTYARVVEIAEGQSGRHVHAHVIIWLPWVKYTDLGAAWARATRGRAEAQGADVKRIKTSRDRRKRAGMYATKAAGLYAAKAAGPRAATRDDVSPLAVLNAADWWGAMYGRRLYTASRGFWVVRAVACGSCDATAAPVFLVRWCAPSRPLAATPHAPCAPPCASACADAAE
jgi:hypothetical protein